MAEKKINILRRPPKDEEELLAEMLKWDQIVADPENLQCSCEVTVCKYHGDCQKCIAVHRYYDGFPACLREFADKLKAEAAAK